MLINILAREISFKIVYYGPGHAGKTTNLQYAYEQANPEHRGNMISIAGELDRALFCDFLAPSLGETGGFKIRLHLYTVPGELCFTPPRLLQLKGVDGIVFVADSQLQRTEANEELMENLQTELGELGYSLEKLPFVIQYNKRDLPNIAEVDELRQILNAANVPGFEAVARTGAGVFDTLNAVAKLVLQAAQRKGGAV
jgi:signal recognition particle receptor subunit beta